jgi:sulfur carrier protein
MFTWPLLRPFFFPNQIQERTLQVTINGEQHDIAESTILEYLTSIGIDPKRVAVELNLAILPKGEYETASLKEGDRIEIVHFVGGG